MAKPNYDSLRTFALVLGGYGIGTGLSAIELVAFTGSQDSIFQIYVVKGVAVILIAWAITLFVESQKSKPKGSSK